jgi:membrane protease subunit HflK
LLFIAILLVAYLATGFYQVRPGERAVVRRFGKVLAQPRLPGLNVGLPWGLDRVDRVAIDEQRRVVVGFLGEDGGPLVTAPAGQVLTGDNQLADVRATIFYRIDRDDPDAAARYVLNSDRAEAVLIRAAEVALTTTLASERVDAVLLGQARQLEQRLQERLVATLASAQFGIAIESVNLSYVKPPAEVAEVFREVNRARTQKEIAEREALSARQTELSAARQEASRQRTDGATAARDRVARAQAEADSFRALWAKYKDANTDVQNALLTLYLREMQIILARMQVRTLSDQNVQQTITLPLPDK